MDKKWMQEAIELAKLGKGFVNPNPKVGAVIVKNGVKIGQGYHKMFGQAHAEVNAIENASDSLEGSTIYVTLEPCHHFGKTPPCVDAIIKNRFSRVVIGMKDPNPKVAGKSVRKLLDHGIEVKVGVLEKECRELNPYFLSLVENSKPYVIMKTAMTLDGKIATASGESKWITGEDSRAYVHELRHDLNGIMVGVNTVILDDPMLTARRNKKSAQPIRIIVDSKGRIPLNSNVVKTAKDYKTVLVTTNKITSDVVNILEAKKVDVIKVDDLNGRVDVVSMLEALVKLGIDSILLEGGGTLNDSMLRSGAVDKIVSFIAPKMFGGSKSMTPVSGVGIESINQAHHLKNVEVMMSGNDICVSGEVVKSCLQD